MWLYYSVQNDEETETELTELSGLLTQWKTTIIKDTHTQNNNNKKGTCVAVLVTVEAFYARCKLPTTVWFQG